MDLQSIEAALGVQASKFKIWVKLQVECGTFTGFYCASSNPPGGDCLNHSMELPVQSEFGTVLFSTP
jgi:hypothetical protein